jgi:hypothetical protein
LLLVVGTACRLKLRFVEFVGQDLNDRLVLLAVKLDFFVMFRLLQLDPGLGFLESRTGVFVFATQSLKPLLIFTYSVGLRRFEFSSPAA